MDIRESALRWITEWWGPRGGVAQFHNPTGVAGRVAGWIMSVRPSNISRSRQAVALLDVHPTDRVMELGCGPGIAVAALAARATAGAVVGVDHSAVMIRQARRRNRASVRAGRTQLVVAAVEDLSDDAYPFSEPFDAAVAINTVGMWREPPEQLRRVVSMLKPRGRVLLVGQPRRPGAERGDSLVYADDLRALLIAAGLEDVHTGLLELDPPAAWAVGRRTETGGDAAP